MESSRVVQQSGKLGQVKNLRGVVNETGYRYRAWGKATARRERNENGELSVHRSSPVGEKDRFAPVRRRRIRRRMFALCPGAMLEMEVRCDGCASAARSVLQIRQQVDRNSGTELGQTPLGCGKVRDLQWGAATCIAPLRKYRLACRYLLACSPTYLGTYLGLGTVA